ncbi:MAG: CaiB/BaiF CoA transferase family protein [Acidimicrobiales bacterium]
MSGANRPSGGERAERDTQRGRLLEGYRVLDLSQYVAGPGVTRMMAELGADVIKIETAPDGDAARLLPVVVDGRSSLFVHQSRGKRSVCVDWSQPEGLALIRELVPACDAVVENFGHGVLERRGLDYESLRPLRPDLVYVSISAFGRRSPWADRPGFDGVVQAFSGLMHMAGDPDGPPQAVGFAIVDNSAAVHAFAALGYALLHRERTGIGQHIDIAMADVMLHLQEVLPSWHASGGSYVPNRMGRQHPLVFPVGFYEAHDGWFFMLCLDRQWPNLCRAMGRPELAEDPRYAEGPSRAANQADLVPIVQAWLLSFPDDDAALAACLEHRVPISKVNSPVDLVTHPHYLARDMIRYVPDPVLGEVLIPGFPFKFGAEPPAAELHAPLLGQHNREVLGELLGYDEARTTALEKAGVLVTGPR